MSDLSSSASPPPLLTSAALALLRPASTVGGANTAADGVSDEGRTYLVASAEIAAPAVAIVLKKYEKEGAGGVVGRDLMALKEAALSSDLPFSPSAVSLILVLVDCDRLSPSPTNACANCACLLAHLYPTSALGVKFSKRHLLEKDEDDAVVWYLLSSCFAVSEHKEVREAALEAARELEMSLEGASARSRAEHLTAILTQSGQSALKSSEEYVKTVFDGLADVFEERLVDKLGYRVPWQLFDIVYEHFREGEAALVSEYINRTMTVVDLGCGTGLVGKCFSALVREKSHERSLLEADLRDTTNHKARLMDAIVEMDAVDPDHNDTDFNEAREENGRVIKKCEGRLSIITNLLEAQEKKGIEAMWEKPKGRMLGCDLSPKMCSAANQTGAYTEMVETVDCDNFLKGFQAETVHIIVSADTYIYVGDLRATFEQSARILVRGGVLAFSIETLGEGVDDKGFKLLPSGRYAQAPSYVKGLAETYGFAVLKEKEIVIRKEQSIDIRGMLFLCCLRESGEA
mmetsp:Transcript_22050/g.44056  ORF Transcript_22050/g.44056 Transcript_22050/m.44056 type:complete len:517 (-) Transcript_22050:36-1586(-)